MLALSGDLLRAKPPGATRRSGPGRSRRTIRRPGFRQADSTLFRPATNTARHPTPKGHHPMLPASQPRIAAGESQP